MTLSRTRIIIPRRLHGIRFDLIAVALLILLWGAANWRYLTPNARDQWSVSGGDFSAHSLVYSSYAASRLSQGEIPLWWTNNYGGQPFFADPEAAAAYPVRWAMIALYGTNWGYGALQAEAMIHLLMAALFTYACARMIGVGFVGALGAAVVFGHSGALNGYPIQQLHILESIVWLPLVIGFVHRSASRASPRSLIFAGAALGLAFLAGHTQTALYEVYIAVAYLIFSARAICKRAWVAIAAQIVLLGAITGLICAVSLLPAAEFLPRTTRDADLDFAAKSSGINFGSLLGALYPGVVALFSPLYVGIGAWLLAALGASVQQITTRFWLGVVIITGLFALGGNSILFTGTFLSLPGISLFRNPERILLITIFAVALLSGFGVQRIIGAGIPRRTWQYLIGGSVALAIVTLLIAVGVTLALLIGGAGDPASHIDLVWYVLIVSATTAALIAWARFNRHPLIGACALAALIIWDLLSWGSAHPVAYEPVPVADRLTPPAFVDLLDKDGAWRIDGARALTPYASLYSLQDVYGVSPLRLTSMAHLLELPVDRFWDLLAIRYVTSQYETLPAPSQIIAQGSDSQGDYFVHELTSSRPYAWLVYHADVNDNAEFARQIIADPRFDPRETVILPQAPALTLPDERPPDSSARLTTYSPEYLEVMVETSENALLTLSLPAYPGWQAQVDGELVTIQPAYTALSAVAVPAGQHTVTLRFIPYSVVIGAILSAAGWIAVLLALFYGPVSRRKSRSGLGSAQTHQVVR